MLYISESKTPLSSQLGQQTHKELEKNVILIVITVLKTCWAFFLKQFFFLISCHSKQLFLKKNTFIPSKKGTRGRVWLQEIQLRFSGLVKNSQNILQKSFILLNEHSTCIVKGCLHLLTPRIHWILMLLNTNLIGRNQCPQKLFYQHHILLQSNKKKLN